MSVHCIIGNAPLFLRVLRTVAIAKESWATCVFTKDVLVLHVVGEDQASTASGTVPRSAFSEFAVTGDAKFTIHVGALTDALLMGGFNTMSMSTVKFMLAFPAHENRLLVEITDRHRTIQTTLMTRQVRERLLDLRFSDALIINRITLRREGVVGFLQDAQAMQCEHIQLEWTPNSLRILGLKSPFAKYVEVSVSKSCDMVLGFDVTNVGIRPKFHAHHLIGACAVAMHHRGGSGGGRSSSSAATGGGGGTSSVFADSNCVADGFERLTLVVNAEQQLCVLHQGLDHIAQPAVVNVVVSPLYDVDTI